MKLCLKIFAIAIIAATTFSLIGCAAPGGFSYQNVNISFALTCSDCGGGAQSGVNLLYDGSKPGVLTVPYGNQQGGSILFTATVTNAPANLTWSLYPSQNLITPNPYPSGSTVPVTEQPPGAVIGAINVQTGNTALYFMNGNGGVEPIYYGEALAQADAMQYVITYQQEVLSNVGVPSLVTVNEPVTGIPQGDVLLEASVPSNPQNPSQVAAAYQLMEIYNGNNSTPTLYMIPRTPTSPSGLTTSVLTVPRNTSYQFYGGVTGAPPCQTTSACGSSPLGTADDTAIWEVGATPTTAVAGGNTTYGTITQTGLYTAPTSIPSGTVVVVLAAHELPSTVASAYITIN
jgi:hypothetical protein